MAHELLATQTTLLAPEQHNAGQVFDLLDISDSTRADYKARIRLFMQFIEGKGLNRNSYLEYKRHLAQRTDISISTKNKYLTCAKIFLK